MATAAKTRATGSSQARESILVEGNGDQTIEVKLISNDGGSRDTNAPPSYSVVISNGGQGREREYAFPEGKSALLRVIITDRPPGEPPGRTGKDEAKGPYLKIVATGGGNFREKKTPARGQTTVLKATIISGNGSARKRKS